MTPPRNSNRFIPWMWLLAGILAWAAVGIRYFGEGRMNWTTAAIGFLCIAMGIAAWKRRSIAATAPDTGGPPPRG